MKLPLGLVIEYVETRRGTDLKGAVRIFRKKLRKELSEEELDGVTEYILEYAIFDYRTRGGRSLLEEYIDENPDELVEVRLKGFSDVLRTHFFSSFEIKRVMRGEWFEVEDYFTGKVYRLWDSLGSENIPESGMIMARIAKSEGKWSIVSGHVEVMPVVMSDQMKKRERERVAGGGRTTTLLEYVNAKYGELNRQEVRMRESFLEKDIAEKRRELRATWEKNVDKWKPGSVWEDVEKCIYNEEGGNVLDLMTEFFGENLAIRRPAFEKQLEFFMDCWNFLPHRVIVGEKSPVEIAREMEQRD